uniref:Uncharacterized protein n=1 Tax=Sphaerodactylus townsendi TaxID=933632 RepID=A0ACB8ETR1_9SAUR
MLLSSALGMQKFECPGYLDWWAWWQKFSRASRIFGVVAKSPADSENICHLFAEYDPIHPASHIVDFVKKILPVA